MVCWYNNHSCILLKDIILFGAREEEGGGVSQHMLACPGIVCEGYCSHGLETPRDATRSGSCVLVTL